MAQLHDDQYKPPMLLLEYEVPETVAGTLGLNSSLNLFGIPIPDQNVKIGNTNISLSSLSKTTSDLFKSNGTQVQNDKVEINGKNSKSSIDFGPKNTVQTIKSIKSKSPNDTVDYNSSHTKGGIAKVDASTIKQKTGARTGWALVRSSTLGYSVLPPGDNRKHIVLSIVPVGAPEDTTAVMWVKKKLVQTPGGIETDGDTNYWNQSAGILKFTKDTKSVNSSPPYNLIDYKADNKYKVLILDDSVNFQYCVVNYYTAWEYIKTGTKISVKADDLSGSQISLPNENLLVDGNFLQKISTSVAEVKTYKKYIIDFYKFSHWPNEKFGFGIEQFTFNGDSRKSIQQTRGTYEIGKESSNNFYVDSWGKGPESIILVGAIELPHAYMNSICSELLETGSGSQNYKSFKDTIEDFFLWNNNPENINNGETLYLLDYYKKITYKVTFKSRKFSQSVERPSVLAFEFTFIVLEKTEKIDEYRK